MNHKEYMNIGEFAKIAGISRRNLLFYDKIGLFSPAAVAKNGYRCYTPEQFYTLDTINILKTVGMPLKDIKDFLQTRTPEKAVELFSRQEQELLSEIERLTYYHKALQTRIWRIKYASSLVLDTVTVEECPAEYYLASARVKGGTGSDIINAYDEADMMKMYFDFLSALKERRLDFGYPMGGVIFGFERTDEETVEYEYQMVQKISREQVTQYDSGDILIKSAGYYLTEFGSAEKRQEGVLTDNMTQYISENGLQLIDPVWEFWWLDDTVTLETKEHIYQTTVRVAK